jgi:hypothetical protein
MEHLIEMSLEMRSSPDLVSKTLDGVSAIVEQATREAKLTEISHGQPEVQLGQMEPSSIATAGFVLVVINFVVVTVPKLYSIIKRLLEIIAERIKERGIPLRKLEVKVDGDTIITFEVQPGSEQFLELDSKAIIKAIIKALNSS